MGQVFKALHELAHDAKDTPGVGVQELIGLRSFEQPLVLRVAPWVLVIIFVLHKS